MDQLNNSSPLYGSFDTFKFLESDPPIGEVVELGNRLLSYVITDKNIEIFYTVCAIAAIFFISVIFYTSIRILEIRKKFHEHLHHEIHEYAHKRAVEQANKKEVRGFKNPRWDTVLSYLFSDNENDWRLAILEADSMLFDLLTEMNFKGDTLGEKLKSANRDTFHSLSMAWEAHGIRNKLAHEGSSFNLTLREAKRVVALYEHIFEEFGYI